MMALKEGKPRENSSFTRGNHAKTGSAPTYIYIYIYIVVWLHLISCRITKRHLIDGPLAIPLAITINSRGILTWLMLVCLLL
jgi:hypothetical protein